MGRDRIKSPGATLPRSGLLPLGKSGALLLFLLLVWPLFAHAEGGALLLRLDGAVGPATADYIVNGIDRARDEKASVVILEMDTPGGLDGAMRRIIQEILASPVPVLTYVAPGGARAASAGTYILYASHVAAMAPGTNLGAATPVTLGGSESQEKAASPERAKAVNDAVAYIRSLAMLRGRNADWAEDAVRQAASLPADRALEMKVVDLVATDVSDLLAQADGRQVMTTMGEKTLATKGLAVETVEPGWRTALLTAITDPNIALILMTIGVYGLLFEFMNPGAVLPGALGGICLIVGLYALNTLPVNYAGLGLILLGLGLLVAEAFAPSFGALGLSGIAAFILGAVILFDTGMPGYRIAWPAIAGVAGMGLLFTFIVIPFAVKAQRRKVVSGWEEMIGADVTIEDWAGEKGHVSIKGERWRARASRPFRAGETARISALDGLTLVIEPSEAPIAGGDAPCSTS